MLHQKLDVRGQFQHVPSQQAYAIELTLGAELDKHVFPEFHQVRSRVHRLSL